MSRGLVFAGLGSAAFDFYGGDRHGDNLFANCTIRSMPRLASIAGTIRRYGMISGIMTCRSIRTSSRSLAKVNRSMLLPR